MSAEENKAESKIYLSSSPHFTKGTRTQKIMLAVLISLLPECVYGCIVFGFNALLTIVASVAACIVFEYLFQKATKQRIVVGNLSAAVTGVLLALVLPPTLPIWMVLIGDAVAIVIAKGLFGGLGSNTFNPALTGRGFMVLSFGGAMSAWLDPVSKKSGLDAISSATILSKVKEGSFTPDSQTLLTYFWGNRAGCIGETSIILILISCLFLLICRIIDWRAPLAMVTTVVLGTFIHSFALSADCIKALTDTAFALVSGGLLFGAVFMVTDYATSPVTKLGRLVFGFGCGLITFLIRTWGGYPEGVMFSILIMNAVVPFLNNLTGVKYGYGKKARHC